MLSFASIALMNIDCAFYLLINITNQCPGRKFLGIYIESVKIPVILNPTGWLHVDRHLPVLLLSFI